MESGEMRLTDALELFQSEFSWHIVEAWAEEANEEVSAYENDGEAIHERFVQTAMETILSQDNAIAIIFDNCEMGESGYETDLMMLATSVVSDDDDVVEQIMRSYQNILGDDNYAEERKFCLQYVIEKSGIIGWKILFNLEVDMDEFYTKEAEWAAIYNGGFGLGPGERHPGGIEEWVNNYKEKKLRNYNEKMGN